MIIIKFKGGLGNIMFQYALGRHLAHKNNTELKFVVGKHNKPNHLIPIADYSFSLEAFNVDIKNRIADPRDIKRLQRYKKRKGKLWFLWNMLIADESKYVKEKNKGFEPKVLDAKNDSYIDGFWQNEKYFKDVRGIILKDFTLKEPLDPENQNTEQQIKAVNSISMHVRRQDYVKDPRTKNRHGSLSKNYYDRALTEILSKQTKDPELFVFSDDIEWVEENMNFPLKTTYVKGNIQAPHEDIYLMSICKHHIIANSSFSWWSAWLCTNPDKIVVAPKKWVQTTKPGERDERVPEDWIKI